MMKWILILFLAGWVGSLFQAAYDAHMRQLHRLFGKNREPEGPRMTRKQLDAELTLLKKQREEAMQALERDRANYALRMEEARQVQALARANVKAGLPASTGLIWDEVEHAHHVIAPH
jgi:hypothetical protein